MPTDPNQPGNVAPTSTSSQTKDEGPVLPVPKQYINYNNYLEDRGDHLHAGEDFVCPTGTPLTACEDGVASLHEDPAGYGHYTDLNVGKYVLRYGHTEASGRKSGPVKRGETIAKCNSGGDATGPHLHFEVRTDGGGFGSDGTIAPQDYLTGAVDPGGGASGAGSSGGGGIGGTNVLGIAKAASISAFLDLPGILDVAESLALKGERSLMNDQPILPFVEQLCQASLRNFQSMPNGNFFAFFPDYFGGLGHRKAYWEISDLEIISGTINLSDDALATHVYVVGDTIAMDGVNTVDKMVTSGVVTVMNAFMADFLNGVNAPLPDNAKNGGGKKKSAAAEAKYQQEVAKIPSLASKDRAVSFLKKYGARPYYEEAPMIRSPYFEMFLAYQKFCLMWSRQFITTFELTFMPELFPGGIVAFPDHQIQCFVEEVVHNCDYQNGFTTTVNFSAPSAMPNSSRTNVHEGMIRAGALDESTLTQGDS
jgi:hypothetical protein